MMTSRMIRSPFFIVFILSAILAIGIDWFSRGFIRQGELRFLYQSLFVLTLSLIVFVGENRLPKSVWLLTGCGIVAGTISGSVSMVLACLVLKSTTTFHAIETVGLGEDVLALSVLSLFGGSFAIGGIAFMAINLFGRSND